MIISTIELEKQSIKFKVGNLYTNGRYVVICQEKIIKVGQEVVPKWYNGVILNSTHDDNAIGQIILDISDPNNGFVEFNGKLTLEQKIEN